MSGELTARAREVHPILGLIIWVGIGLFTSAWYLLRLYLDPTVHYFGLRVTIKLCLASAVLGPVAFIPVLFFIACQDQRPAGRFRDIEARLSGSEAQNPPDTSGHTPTVPIAVEGNSDDDHGSMEYIFVSSSEGSDSYGTISVSPPHGHELS
ncbi:hypothetical protein F4776DRAFT_664831 [Hypoxylon sp. NC0597]|nr:hypothetical protein F4776DRAFT_664831 [Hypoxylon sp. NC0597]